MNDNTDDLIISISTDQATLRRSIQRIDSSLGSLAATVKKQFADAGSAIDKSISTAMQSRINSMVGIGTKASKEWTGALADQGKELERLRAKYSPLFNTINNYKNAVSEIKQAHAVGAISVDEMANAIARERQAALAATAAIKGRNQALQATVVTSGGRDGANSFQTSNLAAQGFDVMATAAFMPWYTVALQQGPQVAQVFNDIKASGSAIGPAVAGAFMQLVNPISLITIGAIGATAAAVQYFSGVVSGSGDAAEKLKEQVQLISAVAEKWGDTIPMLRDYANELNRAKDAADLKEGVTLINEKTLTKVREELESARVSASDLVAQLRAAGEEDEVIKRLQTALQQFTQAAKDGKLETADVERVQSALAAAINSTGIPAISEFAKFFDTLSTSALAAAGNVQKANEAVNRTQDITTWRSYDPEKRRLGRDGQDADGPIQNPGFFDVANPPTPDARPKIELEGLPGSKKADKTAETAAQKAANAYRDLKKAADDRIGQVQQEIELLGRFGIEADAARFSLDLFQQSEDKGRSLSPEQRSEIEKKVALYKQYSETLAQAKLAQDLLMEKRFNTLSAEDQKIITTLRQYGLKEDLGGEQANQIRQNLRIGDAREEMKTFMGDFKSALVNNGGDIGKAFGEALQNALMNQASKLWDKLFDQIINAVLGTSGGAAGATGGGGAIGAAIGAITGGGSSSSKSSTASVSGAVDLASGLLGKNEKSNASSINAFLKKGGVDIDAAQTAWCAAFVNSSLSQVGLKGSGSLTANSFQSWGKSVDLSQVMRGDVLLQSRGLGANQAGGHVGLATGFSRQGKNGTQLQMLSGNSSDSVATTWVDAAQLQARRATEAADALGKVADSSSLATQGLGQLGQLSAGAFPSAPAAGGGGGGGLFSWLGGLFGGNKLNSALKASPQFANAWSKGGLGMYANGTSYSPGGLAIVGEQGPELLNLPQGSQVIPNGKSKQLLAPKAPSLSPRNSTQIVRNESALTVHIEGASGDDHIRMLVNQGVGEAFSQQNENMRRGGFGHIQAQYANQKG
ncbi:phage tail length tape measure family protein [Agrobacterium rosae]|uniref:Tail length tape measure protein n=1 Tax=Agrobacterium rosae TaxID=1972867 RepID=A0ABU4VVS3_9HYPH|nr:tail length tape measure protein [Agrobacterium rosae]MDX8329599.1 tail length tape measure protein [Agrobacterium rosae]